MAGAGTSHKGYGPCRFHGGNLPTVVKSMERRILDQREREYFGQLVTITPIDNPLAVYREFAGRVLAWFNALDAIVQELTDMRYEGERTGEQLRSEVALFERAMDRMNTVLSTYAKLNIDERLAGVTIDQKRMIIRAIEAALADAGIAGPAVQKAKAVAARHLRVVGSEAA